MLICAAKGNPEKPLGNLTFFECEKSLQIFSITIKIFRRSKEGRKNMLSWGPKRGRIRETVGFEERKAERGKIGGLGDGAWHGARWDGPL